MSSHSIILAEDTSSFYVDAGKKIFNFGTILFVMELYRVSSTL